MYISMNWIQDFVDLSGLNIEELIQRFTLSTAEVEEISYKGTELKGVVAGKILSIEDHPQSKKLHLLKVDGGDTVYDVVCGAPNVRENMMVPFVKEGGHVNGMDIKCAEIAGYESHGMCCSEAELGISADHSGLMELVDPVETGADITELYAIKDTVFEVDNKSLTNRPDLWGHYGIAREFAALTGRELRPVDKLDLSAYDSLSPIDIEILDKELCYRYSGLKVHNVTKKVSPVNMRIRLFYCGTRAINLLTDLTNYLMLELGQPMHAFDSAKVDKVEIRRYDEAFQFQTLDGEERAIDENTLMISSGGKPVAIAGIMGGLDSEIEDDTDGLFLESANFDAVCVRKSSTRLGLRTDASMRYEKTLDPEMTVTAIARLVKLLRDIDPGVEVCSALTDVFAKQYPEINLSFDRAYVDRYTGIDIDDATILNTLNALGFQAKQRDSLFHVNVPSWRRTKDVTIKADIIEEITRIYGYDNFRVATTESALFPVKRSPGSKADNYTKDILVQRYHLHEVNSYIWCDRKKYKELGIEAEGYVRLLNSLAADNDVIRNSIVPSLLVFVNENRNYAADFGLFEIARVVEGLKEDGTCNERKKLGIVLYSRTMGEKELYTRLLTMVQTLCADIKHQQGIFSHCAPSYQWQHPKNTAGLCLGEKPLGFVCTLHPTVKNNIDKKACIVAAELDMEDFAAIEDTVIAYDEPSKYPGIDIDLSLLIPDGTTFADMKPAWSADTGLLQNVSLIDTFVDGSGKSITLRFAFSSKEKTLTREELQPQVDAILQNLAGTGIHLKG